MPDAQPKENISRVLPMTPDDFIYLQLKDLKDEFRDSRKELNARMDRIERRMDKLEEELKTTRQELTARMDKQDEKIDALDKKFDEKIDKLAEKIDSSTKHSQILAGSCLAITITVLLSLFFK